MRLYRGAVVPRDIILNTGRGSTIRSELDIPANIGKLSHQDLDTKYHGEALFVTSDRETALRYSILRFVFALLDPVDRNKIFKAETIPVLYTLDAEEDDIYTTDNFITRYSKDNPSIGELIVQNASIKELGIINPEQLLPAMIRLLAPFEFSSVMLRDLDSFIKANANQMQGYSDEMLQTWRSISKSLPDISKAKNTKLEPDLTFADVMFLLSRSNDTTVNPYMLDILSRYLYLDTGLYELSPTVSPTTMPSTEIMLANYAVIMFGLQQLLTYTTTELSQELLMSRDTFGLDPSKPLKPFQYNHFLRNYCISTLSDIGYELWASIVENHSPEYSDLLSQEAILADIQSEQSMR